MDEKNIIHIPSVDFLPLIMHPLVGSFKIVFDSKTQTSLAPRMPQLSGPLPDW
jgi:hypothetical protein